MTQVVINTEDISEEVTGKVESTEDRVEALENEGRVDDFEKAIREDELSTRLRALEVRMEHQQAVSEVNPETDPDPVVNDPDVAEPQTQPYTEPETVPAQDPEEEDPEGEEGPLEDPLEAPSESPTTDPQADPGEFDPTEHPELNPTAETQAAIDDVNAAEKPKRARKPRESAPVQKPGFAQYILGGSGGGKRTRRKAKANK